MENSVNKVIQHRKDKAILKIKRFNFIKKLIIIATIITLLLSFVIGITTVHGVDMAPAIKDGDIVIYFRVASDYSNGDIVVYDYNGEKRISRIGATSGDTLKKGTNDQLVFNERLHPENKDEGLFYKTMARRKLKYPITLNPNEYFMLGDKRDTAEDSRSFGVINKNQIKGKVFTIIRKRGL